MLILGAKKYIAVSLVLLQFAIPFLHAHSGHDLSPDGFHIHGFKVFSGDKQGHDIRALESKVSIGGLIVSVGSALQNDQREPTNVDIFILEPNFGPANHGRLLTPIKFLNDVIVHQPQNFYSSSSPRSPPV